MHRCPQAGSKELKIMAIPVKLEVFEGPLDLLLHLIDKNKVDIYDIPVADITDQYMEYIRNMPVRDMNVMSEFLVMAATLLDIKCRMLLPREVGEDGEEDDPRAELVQKLLEYKMYKYMSYELRDLEAGAQKVFFRDRSMPEEIEKYEVPVDYEQLIGDNDLKKLNEIFQNLMKRQKDRIDPVRSRFGQIEKDEIDIDLKTTYIKAYVREHGTFSFSKLLEKQNSRMEVIVSFLVILEMMKNGEIRTRQDKTFGDILITAADDVTVETQPA